MLLSSKILEDTEGRNHMFYQRLFDHGREFVPAARRYKKRARRNRKRSECAPRASLGKAPVSANNTREVPGNELVFVGNYSDAGYEKLLRLWPTACRTGSSFFSPVYVPAGTLRKTGYQNMIHSQ